MSNEQKTVNNNSVTMSSTPVGAIDMGEFSKVEVKIMKSGVPENAANLESCVEFFKNLPKSEMDRLALEIMRYKTDLDVF